MFAPNWPRKTLDAKIRLNCWAIPTSISQSVGQSTAVNVSLHHTLYFMSYILLYCTVLPVLVFTFVISAILSSLLVENVFIFCNAFNKVIWTLFVKLFAVSWLRFGCKATLHFLRWSTSLSCLYEQWSGAHRGVFCWSQRRKDRNSIMQPGERLLCALLSVDLLGTLLACSTSRWR